VRFDSDDLLISYVMGIGSAEWPHAYQDIELLPDSGPLLDSDSQLAEEDYPYLDLISTVSSRLIYELGDAGLTRILYSDFGQDYHVDVLSASDVEPSVTGWSNWISMEMEFPLFDFEGPLSNSGANPRQVMDPAIASIHQAIRDLEGREALLGFPSNYGAEFALRRGIADLLAPDPDVQHQRLADWLGASDCKRGCCRGFGDIFTGGIAGVLTHVGASWSLEQARVALIEHLRLMWPSARQDFDDLDDGLVCEFNFEDFRPTTGCAWSDVEEGAQLAILDQLVSVADEHPAWFPIALIARHPGSAQSVLQRAASTEARDVGLALMMNESYSPMKAARELLQQAGDMGRDLVAAFDDLPLDDPVVRRFVASDPRCPPSVLAQLALYPNWVVSLILATREDTPPDALGTMRSFIDEGHLRELAMRPSPPGSPGPFQGLLRALAMNPNSPQDLLRSLASRGDLTITYAVLCNAGADPETRALAHLLVN